MPHGRDDWRHRRRTIVRVGAVAGVLGLIVALPAVAQQNSQSLLPPGFDEPPAATPKPPRAQPAPPQPAQPVQSATTPAPGAASLNPDNGVPGAPGAPVATTDTGGAEMDSAAQQQADEIARQNADVPPATRRSLSAVGIIVPATGGLADDAFGSRGGPYLLALLRHIHGPLTSRWAEILLRRTLASRTHTPAGIDPQDWVAERVRLLTDLGEADVARSLAQQVDAARYTTPLYESAMRAYLAAGDIAGFCPLVPGGVAAVGNDEWKMAQAVCASLAGDQGRASSLLNQARRQGWMSGIDYHLTEKAVGAGLNGRRAVKIEWDGVETLNPWRYGLCTALGVAIPPALLATGGPAMAGWRATAPALTAEDRIAAGGNAAVLGVLSGGALVDLYGIAGAGEGGNDAIDARADLLTTAMSAEAVTDRMSAIRQLWSGTAGSSQRYADYILTSQAAAQVTPSTDIDGTDRDQLIAAMMTTGLDLQAARWASLVDPDQLGWAVLAAGRPGIRIARDALIQAVDADRSTNHAKARLLVAALLGLGRIDVPTANEAAARAGTGLGQRTSFTDAIDDAANRREVGTVALLAAAGLQGRGWDDIAPFQLFHIVRALTAVGLEPEARMIAAEGVTRA